MVMKNRPALLISSVLFLTFALSAMGKPPPKTDTFEIADLLALAKKPEIVTVTDLLAALPLHLRRDFTLIKNSGSLQGGTDLAPRVIMMNRSRNLFVTFNGDLKERGSEAIEAASYNSQRERLEFYEIEFAKDRNEFNSKFSVPLASDDIELSDSRVTISKANPLKCMLCHGTTPNYAHENRDQRITGYIWHPYSTWANAYGSQDDYTTVVNPAKEIKNESEKYKEFRALANGHDRYGYLIFGKAPLSPYCDNDYKSKTASNDPYNIVPCRQNLKVTAAVAYNQLDQIADVVIEKFGKKAALAVIDTELECGGHVGEDTLKFENLQTNSIGHILPVRPLFADPAAEQIHVLRTNPKVWDNGDGTILWRNKTRPGGLARHYPAALLRALAKRDQNIAQAFARAQAIAYPDKHRCISEMVAIGYTKEEVRRFMDHFVVIEAESAPENSTAAVTKNICQAVREALKW
jgi:hypothetical protein